MSRKKEKKKKEEGRGNIQTKKKKKKKKEKRIERNPCASPHGHSCHLPIKLFPLSFLFILEGKFFGRFWEKIPRPHHHFPLCPFLSNTLQKVLSSFSHFFFFFFLFFLFSSSLKFTLLNTPLGSLFRGHDFE